MCSAFSLPTSLLTQVYSVTNTLTFIILLQYYVNGQAHGKYDIASEDIRSSFTPMMCTTDGVLYAEFKKVL